MEKIGGKVNNQSRVIKSMSNLLKVISLTAFFSMTAGAVMAQSSLKATGEIVSANKTTINGFSAVSGVTVFNNNRIRTGKDGAAIINLGRLGRIEMGSETDLTLRISETSIGGELRSSQIVVSARAGIAIGVNTTEGIVTSDGRGPAVLTIYVDGKRPRVITHLGVAKVVTTGANSPAPEKEISKSPRGAGQKAASTAAVAVSPTNLSQMGVRAAFATPTFVSLFKAGVDHSIGPKFDNRAPGYNKPFETSITCGASQQRNCLTKSRYRP
jgi:hypothetical protein